MIRNTVRLTIKITYTIQVRDLRKHNVNCSQKTLKPKEIKPFNMRDLLEPEFRLVSTPCPAPISDCNASESATAACVGMIGHWS